MSAINNALAFADMGHTVLPLWGVVETPEPDSTTGKAVFMCACPKGATCSSPGKHPLPRLVPRGLRDAVTDAATISDWAKKEPSANWAVCTDGLIILDQDGPTGRTSLQKLQKDHLRTPDQ